VFFAAFTWLGLLGEEGSLGFVRVWSTWGVELMRVEECDLSGEDGVARGAPPEGVGLVVLEGEEEEEDEAQRVGGARGRRRRLGGEDVAGGVGVAGRERRFRRRRCWDMWAGEGIVGAWCMIEEGDGHCGGENQKDVL
jgi:hypothetical protein